MNVIILCKETIWFATSFNAWYENNHRKALAT